MTKSIISYSELNQALKQAVITLTPSELHGLLTGFVCGGVKQDAWLPLLYKITNDNFAYPTELVEKVNKLHQHIDKTVGNFVDAKFDILLAENDDLFLRINGLSEWVNHFLLGIGLAQPDIDKTEDEITEAFRDVKEIALLGYDEKEDPAELTQSLEDILDYLRIVASLFHTQFNFDVPRFLLGLGDDEPQTLH